MECVKVGVKEHWENVYETKSDQEVSWYQDSPITSLSVIKSLQISRHSELIDVGGGNSNLTMDLLVQGFTNLCVLDISANALARSSEKIGKDSKHVEWVVSDVLSYKPLRKFDLWHDRATFHFLTEEEDIKTYANLVKSSVVSGGYFVIATFSSSGPMKCSGLDIVRYSKDSLVERFQEGFELVDSFEEVHATPFNTKQDFIYAIFRRH